MTTEITETPAENGVSVRRRNYMKALSLAEQIMSETGLLPTNFDVKVPAFAPNEPELRFYFHRDVAGLRQFRDGQMLTESMETREDGSVYIEATREISGVHVEAWTLFPADASAEAAEAVSA
ncbi:hypothetical protein SAMN04487981_101647 [Streptomyces sp. cf386]|uniref:hypothetical protein n=1 Tax=Streptomyces sp. cf386 TaxID=1761904 RepID=UPI000888603D|nr:hypothetical protein [Streptomyces sp. cf386]SDM47648.1 hypothetical protein SAMN04487981_101647 [Streptomyces sp. cf386]